MKFSYPSVLLFVACTFVSASHASNGISSGRMTSKTTPREAEAVLKRAEIAASRNLLSAEEVAFFKAVASIPLLGFISPSSVIWSRSDEIFLGAGEILRNDIAKLNAGEEPVIAASVVQLEAALRYAERMSSWTDTSDFQVFVREARATGYLTWRSSSGPTMEEAAEVIEAWGVDAYDMAARPYYCALGIVGIVTTGAYHVSTCPRNHASR